MTGNHLAAGKTSLTRRLAEHYQAQVLLEKPEANPFLERFYADRKRYAQIIRDRKITVD